MGGYEAPRLTRRQQLWENWKQRMERRFDWLPGWARFVLAQVIVFVVIGIIMKVM